MADLFCGASGMGTGARRAARSLGYQVEMVGVNHWPTAIRTSKINHPHDRFLCSDLNHQHPLDAVPGGRLDLLLAAPSCTHHSRARGGKPVYDQQRSDPWAVIRWCSELRVKRLLVENVAELQTWGPCDPRNGKPIESRKGEYFRAWLAALEGLGFKVDYQVVCCADYGDATTRERLILIGRSDGKPLRRPYPTHAREGAGDLFGARQPWRPIAECIDWSDLGTSLFNRNKPLVAKTIARLLNGARRHHWPRQHRDALQALLDGATPRLDVTIDEARAIAEQLGPSLVMATASGGAARSVALPMPTITTGGNGARPHFCTPILAPYYGSGSGLTANSVLAPAPTITTKARFGLAAPTLTGARIDCLYRMLHWRELARAMSFDDEGEVYQFHGTGAEITKQIGNAVPNRTIQAHVRALLED